MGNWEVADFVGGPADGKAVDVRVGAALWSVQVPEVPSSYHVTTRFPASEEYPPRWGMRVYHYVRDGELLGGRPLFRYSS